MLKLASLLSHENAQKQRKNKEKHDNKRIYMFYTDCTAKLFAAILMVFNGISEIRQRK